MELIGEVVTFKNSLEFEWNTKEKLLGHFWELSDTTWGRIQGKDYKAFYLLG